MEKLDWTGGGGGADDVIGAPEVNGCSGGRGDC